MVSNIGIRPQVFGKYYQFNRLKKVQNDEKLNQPEQGLNSEYKGI